MRFGKAVGTACGSFAITNIDDIFVLVTFFAEATTSKTVTPLKITIGQYLGFTVIVAISMIGFGVALVLPSEPIGFLGLVPMLLGVWKILEILIPIQEDEAAPTTAEGLKSILKVSLITITNGGDNIGTYIPLFAQAKGAEIAVYLVTYYILLGIWCLAAYLTLREKHILHMCQKFSRFVIPPLYVGLGIYIVVTSSCYPWSIYEIDHHVSSHPGKAVLASVTTALLLICMGAMLWLRLRKKKAQRPVSLDHDSNMDSDLDPEMDPEPSSSRSPILVSTSTKQARVSQANASDTIDD